MGQTPPSERALGIRVCGCVWRRTAAPGGFPSSLPVAHNRATPRCARRLSCPTPRRRHGCIAIANTRELLALTGTIPRDDWPIRAPSSATSRYLDRSQSVVNRVRSRAFPAGAGILQFRRDRRSITRRTGEISEERFVIREETRPRSARCATPAEVRSPVGNYADRSEIKVSRKRVTRVIATMGWWRTRDTCQFGVSRSKPTDRCRRSSRDKINHRSAIASHACSAILETPTRL